VTTRVRSTGAASRRPRAEWVRIVEGLRAEGLNGLALARRLGLSSSFVYDLINDPDGTSAKERKSRYAGVCVDCGAPTSGGEGRRDEPRCHPCSARKSGVERTVWTREILIDRMREWAELYGEPPAIPDWNPWDARAMGDEARARRFETSDRWPTYMTVIRAFGSWNGGIVAAGFTPRAAHGGDGNVRRRRSRTVA
jgi:hypothetical protein